MSSNGTRRVTMFSTRHAVCYLTKVSGNMDGAPERVRIFPELDAFGTENWVLETTAGSREFGRSLPCPHRAPSAARLVRHQLDRQAR